MTLKPELRAFLDQPFFGILGTINDDGTIQQTMMWYALEGDTIVMNTAKGRRKHRNIEDRPDVTLSAVNGRQFVSVSGKAVVTADDPDLHFRIGRRYENEDGLRAMFRDHYDLQQRVTISFVIDHVIDGLDV